MTTTFNTNSGIHQLPSNCYPPSDSDDEDSFVVLNNSLGPDIHTDRAHLNTEPISTQTIQASLDSIADILARQVLQPPPNVENQAQSVVDASYVTLPSTEISPDEIQKKVDNLIAENLKLKETLAQNNMAMKKQVETITQWQEEVQRVQESHKEKFVEMKKYITILKNENEQLKEVVKKFESKPPEEEAKKVKELLVKQSDNLMQFELEASLKKVKELEKALDILSLEKESVSKNYLIKEQELNSVLADNKKMLQEIDAYRQLETDRQSDAANAKLALEEEIVELRDTNNNLASEIEELRKQNKSLKTQLADKDVEMHSLGKSRSELEQELAQTKQQLMASQMHITELKESHIRNISEKDQEIKGLQSQLKKCRINADDHAALMAQLDLYKNDFEVERQQRQELLAEKNRMSDDLQQLQRRNSQLYEEIDQMRSGFVPVTRDEARASAPHDSPPLQRHICPICSKKLGSVRMLEDHVEYCLATTTS